ncbi:hypothetical protein BpHYR1_014720 [Brachionus plicatilis]|uniref:Uncharacterized protein n=1 Tax=Brachionus plicatilis TaxID=10195 RepID=A0A3M7RJI8_BRAPC|nr:hypothetical protein BpHYR1_014720 [Brachionus plicatilis]
MSSGAKSRESVLLDQIDDTLNKVEDIPYTQILKEPTTKRKRGKEICYELHSFDTFNILLQCNNYYEILLFK